MTSSGLLTRRLFPPAARLGLKLKSVSQLVPKARQLFRSQFTHLAHQFHHRHRMDQLEVKSSFFKKWLWATSLAAGTCRAVV